MTSQQIEDEELRMPYADLANYLSYLCVNQEEKDVKVPMICANIEPLLKKLKHNHTGE